MPSTLPPLALVAEHLGYDPETGDFKWLIPGRGRRKGVCGSRNTNGYLQIGIQGGRYLASRLAWLLTTGSDPGEYQIDHINRDHTDNRFANLRIVTAGQNLSNRATWGRSGAKCVVVKTLADGTLRYMARVRCDGSNKSLGTYGTMDEAKAAVAEHYKALGLLRFQPEDVKAALETQAA